MLLWKMESVLCLLYSEVYSLVLTTQHSMRDPDYYSFQWQLFVLENLQVGPVKSKSWSSFQDCPDIGSVIEKLTEILVQMHGVGLVSSPLMEVLEWEKSDFFQNYRAWNCY